MAEETRSFEAEVGKILNIVANALYSEREVFLRELISNASDACDKLRYLGLTDAELAKKSGEFEIRITPDKRARTLTIADNGIGMSRDDLIENLGTIARSGTAEFISNLSGDAAKDNALIGQFGVGFYSAFMVADKVDVVTRHAREDQAWRWSSDGHSGYTLAEAERDGIGTTITLHLKKDADEFLEPQRLRHIIKTYSDHIGLPIVLETVEKTGDGKDKDGGAEEAKAETVNAASALWTRPKSEIDEQQYKEFYHHVAHAFDDPWMVIHNRNEGAIEYTNLLFIPGSRPFDLFDPARKTQVKLYVRRVFITDNCDELLPPYLRFVRGVVDSQDLPLNISREMLQNTPLIAKMKSGLTKRVLTELKRKAEKDPEAYATFWDNFGAVLKEGLYEDVGNRDRLLEVARFRTTHSGDELVSLKTYVERMRPGQEAIYYITADDAETAKRSPHLEGFRARDVEVLLLTDPVDNFWLNTVSEFDGKTLKSVARGGADLDKIEKPDGAEGEDKDADKAEKAEGPALDTLIAKIKVALGDMVQDVRASERLTDSAVCLVADDNAMDPQLERLLRQHQQLQTSMPRILEINPGHALIKRLADIAGADDGDKAATVEDAAHLLYEQARIIDGEAPTDPAAFARRMASVMTKAVG